MRAVHDARYTAAEGPEGRVTDNRNEVSGNRAKEVAAERARSRCGPSGAL
jgi:hypothetical protein